MKGLELLNAPQRDAVVHTDGPLLILAGAGSGKTRVITHRIIHLISAADVDPSQILAVTFTNKATQEMRERVDRLLTEIGRPGASSAITISTFHALGARLLRDNPGRVGLSWGFSILDDLDQLKLIRYLMARRDMEPTKQGAKALAAYIERMKNQGNSPKRAHERAFRPEDEQSAWFYEAYQEQLRRDNCADFGDLILGPLEMFRETPELARAYSEQWRHIMVDEFQDTNPAQYELLRQLTLAHDNLVVVGDDDQAIYRWRGATIANLMGFERDFERAQIVKLEQNYRSTQTILDAAHDVITHNPGRRDKRLWTEQGAGEKIVCFTARDDREEAEYAATQIQLATAAGASYGDFAVFFRTNAQARQFEEALRFAGIPYHIVGGTSFYQREEVKDVLAYLKVAINPDNGTDVVRIINTPPRGIGPSTIERLQSIATVPGIGSLFDAIRYVLGTDMTFSGQLDLLSPEPTDPLHEVALDMAEQIKGAQLKGVRDFHDAIQLLRDDLRSFDDPTNAAQQLLEHIHYSGYLKSKHKETAEDRERNVGELLNALQEFTRDYETDLQFQVVKASELLEAEPHDESAAEAALRAFLQHSALVNAPEDEEEGLVSGRVTMMTVHGSKGLEFDTVFLAGMEEGLFPSIRNREDPEELREERRLAYVAITRAERKLFITNAKSRRVYGQKKENQPSRFILDISPQHIVVDPRSAERSVGWSPSAKKFRPVYTGADTEAHFHNPAHEDEDALFNQDTGFVADAAPQYDEFAQVAPTSEAEQTAEVARSARRSKDYDQVRREREALIGATVTHPRFGAGTVLSVRGDGPRALITVQFARSGQKKIMRRFLNVQR